MKFLVLALLALAPSFSYADCISKEEAQVIVTNFLHTSGELLFPYTFENKSNAEKTAIVDQVINNLQVWTQADANGDYQLGYSSLIYSQKSPNGEEYEAYITVECNGEVGVIANSTTSAVKTN